MPESEKEILTNKAKQAGIIDLNDDDVNALISIAKDKDKLNTTVNEVRIREGVGVNSQKSPTLFPPDAGKKDIVRYSYTEGGNGWCFKRPDGTIVCR